MANLNRVLLIGNTTRDVELRYTPKGTATADLGLAINRVLPPSGEGGERREEVVFVDVTVWGRQAEIAQKYLSKGRAVFIEGRLQLDSWEDKQGQKRNKLKVVCEHLQLLGGGRGAAEGGQAEPATAPARKPQPQQRHASAKAAPSLPGDVDENGDPLEVPF
jgi:single-strand DNA-binding protein